MDSIKEKVLDIFCNCNKANKINCNSCKSYIISKDYAEKILNYYLTIYNSMPVHDCDINSIIEEYNRHNDFETLYNCKLSEHIITISNILSDLFPQYLITTHCKEIIEESAKISNWTCFIKENTNKTLMYVIFTHKTEKYSFSVYGTDILEIIYNMCLYYQTNTLNCDNVIKYSIKNLCRTMFEMHQD